MINQNSYNLKPFEKGFVIFFMHFLGHFFAISRVRGSASPHAPQKSQLAEQFSQVSPFGNAH